MSFINLFLLSTIEIFGDFNYKSFARTFNIGDFIRGTLGYIGVVYFLIKSFMAGNVMYVNGMWDGISGLLTSLAAYFILGERLHSLNQYIGIALICFGTLLLHSGGITY